MFKRKIHILILLIIALALFLVPAETVEALDTGVNAVNNSVELGQEDPRTVVGRIINIAILFLGIIAVGIIIIAGFKWMMAEGEEEKVNSAKKLLKNGVIGLIIVLSSWGIATFVLSRVMNSTGNSNPSNTGCSDGEVIECGCGGTRVCIDGSWGLCVGSDCSSDSNKSCDGNTLTDVCNQDNSICDDNSFCNQDCFCEELGGIGDACEADIQSEEGVCSQPSDEMCGNYLTCDADTCTCQGSPVITSISPYGGFCENDVNSPCVQDSDCGTEGEVCNLETPNGASGNLISIHGHNFSTSTELIFLGDLNNENDNTLAVDPNQVNSNCSGVLSDNLIIAVVPSGANSGPIAVRSIDDNLSDNTYNDLGPYIDDFVINNIERPGLCTLDPKQGVLTDEIQYQGLRLNSSDAYFGTYNQKSRGLSSSFSQTSGTSLVPNIQEGKMTTFVIKDFSGFPVKSNYLDFTKEPEADAGPYITSLSPEIGAPGQYVTITGSGFGNVRGFNQVLFGNYEASYDFPSVCQSSVWTDKEVIVKVPENAEDGTYAINMEIDEWEINSNEANPNAFIVDSSQNLKPSLCKIEPIRGPTNSPVTLYGEYFGEINTQAIVDFYYNKRENSEILAENDYLYLETQVPQNASTGPVKVIKDSEAGNSLDFSVEQCEVNDDCGNQICCPAGTYKEGRCENEGTNSIYENCYVDIPSSMYQWNFSTGWENPDNYYSCEGMAKAMGACQVDEFCPNSPGKCSIYPGGGQTVSSECDYSCDSYPGCEDENNCLYNDGLDKCVLEGSSCYLSEQISYSLGDETYYTYQTCQEYEGENGTANRLHINVDSSCPENWTNIGDGVCVNENETCSVCEDDNLSCVNNGQGGGVCATDTICDNGAICTSDDVCVIDDEATCECCCEIGEDERDCCAPLNCDNSCGSDREGEDTDTYGYCSGCAFAGGTQAEQDEACNCFHTSGKFCDVSEYSEGICVDCEELSTPELCNAHVGSCCYDGENDTCRGIDEGGVVEDTDSDFTGYCAYYDCNQTSGECNVGNPSHEGDYSNPSTCEENCASEDPCLGLDATTCANNSDCCFDVNGVDVEDGECRSGEDMGGEGDDASYCAYYNCQENNNLCDLGNPNPNFEYEDKLTCQDNCEKDPSNLGASCSSEEEGICDTFICGSPFACLAQDGSGGSSSDCGFCCCNPDNINDDPEAPDYDSCLDINSNLNCEANRTPCDGENRGLCCGCSADSECGDEGLVGCGLDTCCRNRPQVDTDKGVNPSNMQSDVCRNVLITVPFDQKMDRTSFNNNLVLLAEYDYGSTCPAGTFLANKDLEAPKFVWWKKIKSNISKTLSPILARLNLNSASSALAEWNSVPTENDLYCLVPGTVSYENSPNGNTTLTYSSNKVLDADTVHYAIVKGDENLDSNTGVKSYQDIGMNGEGLWSINDSGYIEGENLSFNGINYPNAYIWKFETLDDQGDDPGICKVDYVRTEPDSYLFSTTQNSLIEDDTNPADNSYDTIKDRDKEYHAKAFSSNGQRLARTSQYDWDWNWYIDNIDVVKFINQNSSQFTVSNNKQLIGTADNVSDGQTFVKATVDMSSYTNNITSDGDGTSHAVPAYVFICNNPWPAPDPNTNAWSPWMDNSQNCLPGEECDSYNYNFYYCRDAGEEGTHDDLPAIIDEDAVIRGSSKVCSDGSGPCSNDSDCGGAQCIWDVLKESYFFREKVPGIGTISEVDDLETGGTLKVSWSSDSYLVNNYILYYRDKQSQTYSFAEVELDDSSNPDNPNAGQACNELGGEYICNYVINNLENNKTYYFKISAVTNTGAESPLSNQVVGIPTDKQAPTTPMGLGAESN
ncbi:IPT/TIG domain-containing protein [Patescibacteria group bacterium]|nr:IPT/TIG domain-containing protein [Patescibacteria group bacterium]